MTRAYQKRGPMAAAINTDELKIEQPAPIFDHKTYDGDVVLTDNDMIDKDYADALAFSEEPVMIRLEPTGEKNAPTVYPVWVNGRGAEVFQNGRWFELTYLPIGTELTIKRKYLEVLVRSKITTIQHGVPNPQDEHPHNRLDRSTSAVHSVTVLEDPSPKGRAWLTEMRRRNL